MVKTKAAKLLPLRLQRIQVRAFRKERRDFCFERTCPNEISILWMSLNTPFWDFNQTFWGILEDILKNVEEYWNNSKEFQTDWWVISINMEIFAWGTGGSSEGMYVVKCQHVLVKFQYDGLHSLRGIFWDYLRENWWPFWGNLRESMRFQGFVEIFWKLY